MRLIRLTAILISLLAAAYSCAETVVLGKLGQTTVKASIYASMNTHARVFYHEKAYSYLVLSDTKNSKWLRVLMNNGWYGYVQADKVAKLPYQVTTERAAAPTRDTSIGASRGSSIARNAMNYIGTPYVWGGNDPTAGIDCSGFVKQMYGQIGVSLPRTAAEQAYVGQPITRLEDLQAGDRLYFWESKRGKIGHTGIYLGKGYFVHSSVGHHGVATDYLGSKNWLKILVAARRS